MKIIVALQDNVCILNYISEDLCPPSRKCMYVRPHKWRSLSSLEPTFICKTSKMTIIVAPPGNVCMLYFIAKILTALWGSVCMLDTISKDPCRTSRQCLYWKHIISFDSFTRFKYHLCINVLQFYYCLIAYCKFYIILIHLCDCIIHFNLVVISPDTKLHH